MKRCYKCGATKNVEDFNKNKTKKDGFGDLCRSCVSDYLSSVSAKTSRLFAGCKRRAALSKGKLTISRDWIRDRLDNGFCEITKLPFNFSGREGYTRQPHAPSVDRIDPKNPDYTPENCRLVLWAVNCAMAEYGEEIMIPIFKAILHANKRTATPVSKGTNSPSEIYPELGSFSTTGPWQDSDNPDNHSGTIQGKDADHSAQESSRDGMGRGGQEVATFVTSYDIQNNGLPCAENILAEHRGRRILD